MGYLNHEEKGRSWPVPGIPFTHWYVSFLRNENQFPDSGHSRVALQWAVPDPERTYTDCL